MIEYTVKVNKIGDTFWKLNGKRHREDGPAIEYASGSKHWFINGKRHREDGPAIEFVGGEEQWYLNGVKLTKEQHKIKTNPVKDYTIKLLGYNLRIVK